MKVSRIIITIPAFNEEKTISSVIDSIKKALSKAPFQYKIMVVDDGSTDRTRQIVEAKGCMVFSHQRNLGLAETFRTEIMECLKLNVDAIVHIDADGQYNPADIPRLIAEIEKGYDLVLGSRFKGNIEEMPAIKRFGNKAFSRVISHITGLRITDSQTGFRAFTKAIAEQIKISSTHTYTQEQIIRAAREKFKIKEIPVNFAKRGQNTTSRLISNPFEYAFKAWLNILRILRDYEPLKFFGSFGLLFMIFGFLLGIWLLSVYLRTGIIGHPYVAFLMVLLFSIGLQLWFFGFLADMMRK